MNSFAVIFTDYTIRNVVIGTAIIGIVSGSLGSFAVLRKQGLLGDAISHASLPGIALAFLITQSKAPIVLLIGAAIVGWLGTLFIMHIVRNSRVKEDGAMGIILSVFFGIGMVILTFIQRLPTASKAGLDKFLFGQSATLMSEDVITMSIVGGVVFIVMLLFWKEFKILTFDREFGGSLGLSMRAADILLTSCIVIAIVLGLQAVGVILMSAMVVSPGVSARQWTDKLGSMVIISALIGAISGVSGALISNAVPNLPTGPTIVVAVTSIMIFSILFASRRGLVWNALREYRNRKRFALDGILTDLYTLARQHGDLEYGHPVETLNLMRMNKEGVRQGLNVLKERGFVASVDDGKWALTSRGVKKAEELGGAT